MSDKRNRDHRRERQPTFDEPPDSYVPAAKSGPPIRSPSEILDATLLRFNRDRGFGFVGFADGSKDAFLHASTVKEHADHLVPGTRLRVRLGADQRGRTVAEVISVKPPVPVMGKVKWYQATKEFGFIIADDGSPDIFLSEKALQRSNIGTLRAGQTVEVVVVETKRGREAHQLKIIGGQ